MNARIHSLLTACTLGVIPASAQAAETLLADFEGGDYGDWKVEGTAFGRKPAAGTLRGQQKVAGFLGKGLVNTFIDGDKPVGTLTSPPFRIDRPYLSFLIGGGNHPGQVGIELLVEGRSVRAATGLNEELLEWKSWDVREFAGMEGVLRIYDRATGGFGHINVDHIHLGDRMKGEIRAGRLASYRKSPLYYREPFRPRFHFTPPVNWMNDPNGMVYYDGEWHLFYQHNPHGNTWGHMSWGHAVSRDLVNWEHLPIALQDHYGVMIFSGSAVVDWKNTSGFGNGREPPLVAIYTGHGHGKQTQDLAFSNDRGRTWTKYDGNPVLDINASDFRDPKVIWHEGTARWIMTVAMPREHQVRFYASPDLKKWTLLSAFGPAGATKGIWECPDLFPMVVDGTERTKWVLIVNLNPGHPAGGSGCQYFVGDFDGRRFELDASHPIPGDSPNGGDGSEALWLDHGPDYYATVTWSEVPKEDGRRVALGWMSNWQYANRVPTSPWRSAMTVPRVLKLRQTGEGLRVFQEPPAELESLRDGPALAFSGGSLEEAAGWLAEQKDLPPTLEVELGLEDFTGGVVELAIVSGEGEQTAVRCDATKRRLVVDRTASGRSEFHPAFAAAHEAPLPLVNGRLAMRLLLDTASLELFANEGGVAFTQVMFPSSEARALRLRGEGGAKPEVSRIAIHRLAPARLGGFAR